MWLKISVLMGFNGDIFVQKVLSFTFLCLVQNKFIKGNEGGILKFQ